MPIAVLDYSDLITMGGNDLLTCEFGKIRLTRDLLVNRSLIYNINWTKLCNDNFRSVITTHAPLVVPVIYESLVIVSLVQYNTVQRYPITLLFVTVLVLVLNMLQ